MPLNKRSAEKIRAHYERVLEYKNDLECAAAYYEAYTHVRRELICNEWRSAEIILHLGEEIHNWYFFGHKKIVQSFITRHYKELKSVS